MRYFVISEEDLKNFIRTSKLYGFACECVFYSPSEEELEVTEENLKRFKELKEYTDKENTWNAMMKYYKISGKDLIKLIEKAKFLSALEAYGVDNWEGYEMVEDEEYEVSEEDYEEYGAILETDIDNATHKPISAEEKVKLIEEFVDCYDMREEWDQWNNG